MLFFSRGWKVRDKRTYGAKYRELWEGNLFESLKRSEIRLEVDPPAEI